VKEPAACPPRADQGGRRNGRTLDALGRDHLGGKIEDFKRLAEEMLNTIRAKDSGTLNFAIFLNEPASPESEGPSGERPN
jgi:hypothetical protein